MTLYDPQGIPIIAGSGEAALPRAYPPMEYQVEVRLII
jgi:hypothetical protein